MGNRILGVVLITAGVLAMMFMYSGNSFAGDRSFMKWKEVGQSKSVPAAGIERVAVDVSSANVAVVKGSADEIKVRLEGKAGFLFGDNVELVTATEGDALKISASMPNGPRFGIGTKMKLTVELPDKQWQSVVLETNSGDIDLKQVRGKTVEAKALSGDVSAAQVDAGTFAVSTNSGDVDAKEVKAATISLEAKSGDITADRYTADRLTFDVSSGNVRLSNGQSAIQGETTSGNIQLAVEQLLHDADLRAGSGNVTVNTRRDPKSVAVDYEGGSGEGKVKWSGMTVQQQTEKGHRLKGAFGSGDVKLTVRTNSGNFTLGQGD